jgi:hypothetical protein
MSVSLSLSGVEKIYHNYLSMPTQIVQPIARFIKLIIIEPLRVATLSSDSLTFKEAVLLRKPPFRKLETRYYYKKRELRKPSNSRPNRVTLQTEKKNCYKQ